MSAKAVSLLWKRYITPFNHKYPKEIRNMNSRTKLGTDVPSPLHAVQNSNSCDRFGKVPIPPLVKSINLLTLKPHWCRIVECKILLYSKDLLVWAEKVSQEFVEEGAEHLPAMKIKEEKNQKRLGLTTHCHIFITAFKVSFSKKMLTKALQSEGSLHHYYSGRQKHQN